jgi:hypothetical protein
VHAGLCMDCGCCLEYKVDSEYLWVRFGRVVGWGDILVEVCNCFVVVYGWQEL